MAVVVVMIKEFKAITMSGTRENKDLCICISACVTVFVPPGLCTVCGRIKCDESSCVLSMDLLHSVLYFVVERAFVASTYNAQVFLGLRRGDEWKECDGHWGYRIEVGPWQKWICKGEGGVKTWQG